MPKSFYIRTFGCQMNEHDSERLAGMLVADGLEPTEIMEQADVVVLNTCCIRENADQKLYGTLGSLKTLVDAKPGLQIAVGGCLAQKDRELIQEKVGWVDVVFGTHNLGSAPGLLRRATTEGQVMEILDAPDPETISNHLMAPAAVRELPYAAWVNIQMGCDNSCAFCIVPAVRGPEVSRPVNDIVGEVEDLARRGVIEVTLLGQNVNSYGRDITHRRPLFADLLGRIGAVDGIGRIRFTSPHPKDLRPETIAAMAETPEVCEQLHLPLQSGSSRVLSAMRRGYTAERYLERLAAARAAIDDLAVTTDIIVGFPGETERDFEDTLAVAAEAAYDSAYTFIFSPRPGTRAAEHGGRFHRTGRDRRPVRPSQDGGGALGPGAAPGPGRPGRRGAGGRREPPRRVDADGADPPREAGPLRGHRPGHGRHPGGGVCGPGHHHGRAPAPPFGRPRCGDGAAAASGPHPGGQRVTAVALVGVTASGKSEAARAVALRRGDTEIVSVDSMCVYRGMDLGTSKPTPAEQAQIPHHLIDLVDPETEYTVSEFQLAARSVLADIEARGRHALLVGGTGLYLRAVVDDLRIPGRYPDVAVALERELDDGVIDVAGLHDRLALVDPVGAERMEPTNRRRIVRALEVTIGSGQPFSSFGPGLEAYPPSVVPMIGIVAAPDEVDRQIEKRFAEWMDAGLLDEVRALAERPQGIGRTARQALGYRELLAHVEDGRDLAACVEEAVRRTRTLARRQASWFGRDPRIVWAEPGVDLDERLDHALGAHGQGR